MIVLLRTDFFAPNDTLYPKTREGTEIPDKFRDFLPDDARIIGEKLVIDHDASRMRPPVAEPTSFRAYDVERANQEAYDRKAQEAADALEAQRQENAAKLRKELAKK